jgi:predicted SprT family Zn-dependent metalloprotease
MPVTKRRALEIYTKHHKDFLEPLGKHVKIKFNKNKSRAGVSFFEPDGIQLSEYYLKCEHVSEGDVNNVILHEIAHIIAGFKAGHGPEWKRVATSIGCDAARCVKPFVSKSDYKHILKCGHGCVVRRHKLRKGKIMICKKHRKILK